MFFGLVLGLLVSFSYAGLDVIYHWVLRGILTLSEGLRFRYVAVLDQAAVLGLLRKVGGAYVFYHPLLKERLAVRTQNNRSETSGRWRRHSRRYKEAELSLHSLITGF
jgi:hypothetical protein